MNAEPAQHKEKTGYIETLLLATKLIASAFSTILLLHGLLPLYAVFLSCVAFYPAFAVLIDLMSGANTIKDLTKQIASLALNVLVAVIFVLTFYLPSLTFLVAYLPAAIIALVCFNLACFFSSDDLFKFMAMPLTCDFSYDDLFKFMVMPLITITAVMFGSGLLVEANFVLAASLIGSVWLLILIVPHIIKNHRLLSDLCLLFFLFFFNPLSTITLAIIFGLSGFGLLPALVLTNPVFASIWVFFILTYSFVPTLASLSIVNNRNEEKNKIKCLTFLFIICLTSLYLFLGHIINPVFITIGAVFIIACYLTNVIPKLTHLNEHKRAFAICLLVCTLILGAGYIITSLIVNPGVGFFAALTLGASSPIVLAIMISSFISIVTPSLVFFKMIYSDKTATNILNSAILSTLVYIIASYILAPAGTPFTLMLVSNVAIALPLSLFVSSLAINIKLFRDITDPQYIYFNILNTKTNHKKVIIIVLSLLTFAIGPILAFSGMFEIFAATSTMQALTVATSAIVAATVWRTLDKALFNSENECDHNKNKINSPGTIALKALGVILFAGAGYLLAAILPMFAGLVLPTWSALAPVFSVVSVPGVFTAIISATYATNIASFYLPHHPELLFEPSTLADLLLINNCRFEINIITNYSQAVRHIKNKLCEKIYDHIKFENDDDSYVLSDLYVKNKSTNEYIAIICFDVHKDFPYTKQQNSSSYYSKFLIHVKQKGSSSNYLKCLIEEELKSYLNTPQLNAN